MSSIVWCNRFCAYDPHGVYQRIDCLAREYLVKRKSYLTPLYMSLPSDGVSSVGGGDADQTLASVDNVVSALLHEYDALKDILKTISPALVPLVWLHFAAIKIILIINYNYNYNYNNVLLQGSFCVEDQPHWWSLPIIFFSSFLSFETQGDWHYANFVYLNYT